MNLLEIIGINSCWKTFFVAFCFMSGEVEADYTWALNCLKSLYDEINVPNVFAIDRELAELNSLRIVFPDSKVLLCVWHINKNIAKNFKGTFSSEDWTIFLNKWNSIVYATSEEDYEEKWQLLKLHLGENSRIIQYLTETWMVHKRLFLSCYISDVMHLGSHTTSRVEGAHSTLKGYLENSLGDLKSVKERIYLAIKAQLQQLSAQIADEKLKVPHYLDVNFLSSLSRKISKYALNLIKAEYDKARDNNVIVPCRRYHRRVLGLPCSHEIRQKLVEGSVLSIANIHPHWYLYREEITPLTLDESFAHIRNPEIVQGRGRPLGAPNRQTERSLRREPSGFEITEGRLEGRICSICGIRGTGHNARSCPLRLR